MKSTSRRKPGQGNEDSRDSASQSNIEDSQFSTSRHSKSRRTATIYDAVAGRIGLNGFLKAEQIQSGQTRPLAAEEALLRRVNAPDQISYDYYNADERLDASQKLPESDLLKDVHSYVADYYELANDEDPKIDFQSFDETALLAMGILLEEACKEAVGENGDMVFSEPALHDKQADRGRLAQHQIIGKVIPPEIQEYQSSSEESSGVIESRPRKKQRRRYFDSNDY